METARESSETNVQTNEGTFQFNVIAQRKNIRTQIDSQSIYGGKLKEQFHFFFLNRIETTECRLPR